MSRNTEVHISKDTYAKQWPMMYFFRVMGFFPFVVKKDKAQFLLKWSPMYTFYSFVLTVIIISLASYGILVDASVEKAKSIRVRSEIDRFVISVGMGIYMVMLFCGFTLGSCNVTKFLNYVRCMNEVDEVLRPTWKKSHKNIPILIIVGLSFHTFSDTVIDFYMFCTVSGKRVGVENIFKRYLGFHVVLYLTCMVEYTIQHMIDTLIIRLRRLNELLQIEYDQIKDTEVLQTKLRYSQTKEITKLRQSFMRLMDGTKLLNDLLGTIILTTIAGCYSGLIIAPFLLFSELFGQRKNLFFIVQKLVFFSTNLVRVILIIETPYAYMLEMQNTRSLVCKLMSLRVTKQFRNTMKVFATVMGLRNFCFTGLDLFTAGRSLFTSVAGSVTTLVLFLLDLQQNEDH